MFGIGAGELLIILIAGLVIFGPSKLPEVGRAIGKGLREVRKAQAAFSATLDEVSDDKAKSENKVENEKTVEAEKTVSLEKNPKSNEPEKSAVSVDDVIELAKSSPLVKENVNEKISNGNDSVTADTNVSKRVESAGSGGHGAEK